MNVSQFLGLPKYARDAIRELRAERTAAVKRSQMLTNELLNAAATLEALGVRGRADNIRRVCAEGST